MYVEYDDDVDGAFVWLVDDIETQRSRITRELWPDTLNDEVGLLFDDDGKLLGIEVQPASTRLDPTVLKTAKRY